MRRGPYEQGIGMQEGKDLERGLLGSPKSFDEALEIPKNFQPKDVAPLVRKHEARLMSLTRENQSDNPRAPKKPFARRLASDIDNALVKGIDLPEEYEVRVYSAVGTALDAAGIDFWVELYDSDLEKTISIYKVDLKSHPYRPKGELADVLYYLDYEVASDDNKEAIYEQGEYSDLVSGAVERFKSALRKSISRETREGISRLQL